MNEIDYDKCESFLNDDHKLCPRCSKDGKACCEIRWEECQDCGGDGFDGHDCGEVVCCCLDPEENVPCQYCRGEGGWWECAGRCDKDGKHKRKSPCAS